MNEFEIYLGALFISFCLVLVKVAIVPTMPVWIVLAPLIITGFVHLCVEIAE